MLSSAAQLTLSDETKARRLVGELRAVWGGSDLLMGNSRYTLLVGLLKSARRTASTSTTDGDGEDGPTIFAGGTHTHTDRRLPTWKIVCSQRVASLKKDSTEVIFHKDWYNVEFYTTTKDTVEKDIRDSTTL